MTSEEALEIITHLPVVRDEQDKEAKSNIAEALDVAVKALERDTPKECKMFRDTCECVHSVFPHMRYCDQCGKRLVWR